MKRIKKFVLYLWNKTKGFYLFIWKQLKDKTNLIIFAAVTVVLSAEVWVPCLISLITGNKYLWSVGVGWWVFWQLPGTPFIGLCLGLTFAGRKIYDKIRSKRKMWLKPKSTTLNPKGTLYKRFISLAKSDTLNVVYNTIDGKQWIFDSQTLAFTERTATDSLPLGSIIPLLPNIFLQYLDNYWHYNNTVGWMKSGLPQSGIELLSVQFANIAKYNTNRYYKTGTFDYVVKGDNAANTVQYIKGNIMPINTLNISYFDDYIKISPDDLVVIDKKLYSVESVTVDHKHQPKDFNIYAATLNSIL